MDALQKEIDAYRDEHWDDVLADIEALVKVASVEDLTSAAPNAPYGPGPREALDAALAIAKRMGLEAHDCEGHIGYADFAGASDTQIGIIGHVDVVPAGPGWSFEPHALTRRDGYLLGRGVIDDKGPLMVALHAVKFWKDRCDERGEQFPYTVRVLFGANEETNMKDVAYYRAHYDDPVFLFTPDSQFPLGYGESGICSGTLTSAAFPHAQIVEMGGGQAVNAVPGLAWALVRARPELLQRVSTDAIQLEEAPGGDGRLVRVEAQGVSAHASTPELGVNAIGVLVDFLLEAGIGAPEERAFLELLQRVHRATDGSELGVSCADEHFGPLTVVGGVVSLRDGRICQSLDFRYPTGMASDEIERRVNAVAAEVAPGASFAMEHDKEPFLMNPDSAAVRALLDAYCEVTGERARGLTSKGGTYARCFTAGVSFGPEKPWVQTPAWVGSMHGPDEGVSEDLLKQAFSVYARALGNLSQCALR